MCLACTSLFQALREMCEGEGEGTKTREESPRFHPLALSFAHLSRSLEQARHLLLVGLASKDLSRGTHMEFAEKIETMKYCVNVNCRNYIASNFQLLEFWQVILFKALLI